MFFYIFKHLKYFLIFILFFLIEPNKGLAESVASARLHHQVLFVLDLEIQHQHLDMLKFRNRVFFTRIPKLSKWNWSKIYLHFPAEPHGSWARVESSKRGEKFELSILCPLSGVTPCIFNTNSGLSDQSSIIRPIADPRGTQRPGSHLERHRKCWVCCSGHRQVPLLISVFSFLVSFHYFLYSLFLGFVQLQHYLTVQGLRDSDSSSRRP